MDDIEENVVLPPPFDPNPEEQDDRRIWIGNIDAKLTEFVLLKSLQKYGTLIKFDYLYHKAGPDKGKPRGYCFVTYKAKEESAKAIKALNGALIMNKRLVAKWANADTKSYDQPVKLKLGNNRNYTEKKTNLNPASAEAKIRAIEAKLKRMDDDKGDSFNVVLGSKKHESLQESSRVQPSSYSNKQQRRANHPYKR
ncbi:putative RNA-binding protein 18 [Tubulanus polymorphus]|uniref:putative RNA-binding protein 18 n=1 Tax=Tubulanus polymorphus TaxID=672921 RepID=UPI003DA39760